MKDREIAKLALLYYNIFSPKNQEVLGGKFMKKQNFKKEATIWYSMQMNHSGNFLMSY